MHLFQETVSHGSSVLPRKLTMHEHCTLQQCQQITTNVMSNDYKDLS